LAGESQAEKRPNSTPNRALHSRGIGSREDKSFIFFPLSTTSIAQGYNQNTPAAAALCRASARCRTSAADCLAIDGTILGND